MTFDDDDDDDDHDRAMKRNDEVRKTIATHYDILKASDLSDFEEKVRQQVIKDIDENIWRAFVRNQVDANTVITGLLTEIRNLLREKLL